MKTLTQIEAITCRVFDIEPQEMKSRTRRREISEARQVAMYLSRVHTGKSLYRIGIHYNRDHATVLYSYRHIRDLIQFDSELREKVGTANDLINSHADPYRALSQKWNNLVALKIGKEVGDLIEPEFYNAIGQH